MPIYVCVKHVPDTGAVITLAGKTVFEEKGIKFIMNPYDEFAVEEALQWGEKRGEEVVAVTLGKADATSTLQTALALGAVRGVHIVTDQQYNNPALIAKALAGGIKDDGTPTVVFTGKQSIGTEGMQLPYLLGHELNLPVVNEVIALALNGDTVKATREIGGGNKEVIEMALPCLIGATKGLNTPRYPKLPDIMKAKKKPIKQIPVADVVPKDAKARRILEDLSLVQERAAGQKAVIFQGTLEEKVAQLRAIIKEKAKI